MTARRRSRHRRRTRVYEPHAGMSEPLHPEWLEHPVPYGFWTDRANHRRYMLWLGRQLGYRTWEDWYRITIGDFHDNHGQTLLSNYYGKVPIRAVIANFPEYDWHEWLFHIVPDGFWNDPANRRRYMAWLAGRLGFTRPEDWYRVTLETFQENDGSSFIHKAHGNSVIAAVKEQFPAHDWKEWLFGWPGHDFWSRRENRRRYVEWLGEQLSYRRPEDWYQIDVATIRAHRGGGLVHVYGNSPSALVMDCFTEHEWHEWRFPFVPDGFWKRRANRLRYLKWLERQLGIDRPEGWYQVTRDEFYLHDGTALIDMHYRASVPRAARELYPDYDWCEWLFRGSPKGIWRKHANRRRFMQWLGERLGCKRPGDWYRVSKTKFRQHGGGTLLDKHYGGSLLAALKEFVPDHDWRPELFRPGKSAGSRAAQAKTSPARTRLRKR